MRLGLCGHAVAHEVQQAADAARSLEGPGEVAPPVVVGTVGDAGGRHLDFAQEVPAVVEKRRRGGGRDLQDAAVQGVVAVGDHHAAVVRGGGQAVLAVPSVAPAVGKTVGHAVVLRLDAADGVRDEGYLGREAVVAADYSHDLAAVRKRHRVARLGRVEAVAVRHGRDGVAKRHGASISVALF